MQSGKCRTKLELRCLGKQHKPQPILEADSLTKRVLFALPYASSRQGKHYNEKTASDAIIIVNLWLVNMSFSAIVSPIHSKLKVGDFDCNSGTVLSEQSCHEIGLLMSESLNSHVFDPVGRELNHHGQR
jgi:hypothetical protein